MGAAEAVSAEAAPEAIAVLLLSPRLTEPWTRVSAGVV